MKIFFYVSLEYVDYFYPMSSTVYNKYIFYNV